MGRRLLKQPYKTKRMTMPGDKRIRSAFLLFPKKIQGEWRWLRFASYEEEIIERTALGDVPFTFLDYAARRWVD